jgi:hypothetical protein
VLAASRPLRRGCHFECAPWGDLFDVDFWLAGQNGASGAVSSGNTKPVRAVLVRTPVLTSTLRLVFCCWSHASFGQTSAMTT